MHPTHPRYEDKLEFAKRDKRELGVSVVYATLLTPPIIWFWDWLLYPSLWIMPLYWATMVPLALLGGKYNDRIYDWLKLQAYLLRARF